MSQVHVVESIENVVMQVEITTPADPSDDPIEWAFTPAGSDVTPTSWTVGAWVGEFVPGPPNRSGTIEAISPLLPSATSTVTLAKGRWTAWARWQVGSEDPAKRAFQLLVR